MVAGRELDALVAEKVFGWKWYTFLSASYILPPNAEERGIVFGVDSWSAWKSGKLEEPDYEGQRLTDMRHHVIGPLSTEIAAAWEVVEKLRDRHGVTIAGGPDDEGMDDWVVTVKEDGYRSFQDQEWEARSERLPHAICKAALAAVGASLPPTRKE